MKVVVIGGGSTYTPELIEGFFDIWNKVEALEIVLVDIDEHRLNIVYEFLKRMINRVKAKIELKKSIDLDSVLQGTDFVINQIRVGGNKARLLDETIPLEFNLLGQETTGPGGFANALRTIPVVYDIAKKVEKYAPDAHFINFTNPSGIITEMLLNYTKIKAIGLCNVPINFQRFFADLAGVNMDDVFMDYFGLNHLSFVRRVFIKGEDKTEELFEKAKEKVSDKEKKIIDYLNMFPNYYLRYYYFREEMVEELKHKPKRAEEVMKVEEDLLRLYQDPNLDTKPVELSKRGGALYSKAAVNLISHLYGLEEGFQIINVKNDGSIYDLPYDGVVEIPVYIQKDRFHRYSIGNLPMEVRGLIQGVKAYERLTIEAAMEGSYRKALLAISQHPLVSSLSLAEKLLNRLIEVNRELFPELK
ncbi:6-phospho-beta-glucosidase [Dictyoglomus thermophilum]|uniref:6-phospho-beta-glucosidase BglT n=2 Tax=Dictyoglomus thermophilum TaxID=14 RepID=B5YAB4_DICT6|nr:6-phospho-beta-glucosidase [Dictyoglomus thermophilum]ACI19393.1 6-phospho-beta-glucosidase BglT [Dictyoglomus thermophilum H-6-12]MCX7720435.1 6-phospho-beta-glucosidase [Dictyoglomus thermophilum]TYT24426.1 6-phospho-beta-glucosidase [Dictyoglomus thermophilum]